MKNMEHNGLPRGQRTGMITAVALSAAILALTTGFLVNRFISRVIKGSTQCA